MTPIERLRNADPAAGTALDERAERELDALLARPAPQASTTVPLLPRPRSRGPLLVTALIAAVVVALTALVLTVVHPRSDVAAPSGIGAGRYEVVGGTGRLAFLEPDQYTLEVELLGRSDRGVLQLQGQCDTITVQVTIAKATMSQGGATSVQNGCFGIERSDSTAMRQFFVAATTPIRADRAGTTLILSNGADSVTFRLRTASSAPVPTAAATVGPPYDLTCHPAEVLPFLCGTYRSVYGAASVTGDTGGPVKDPLSIEFSSKDGVLVLVAESSTCFTETVPVRWNGTRLIRVGAAAYGEGGCHGPGADMRNWAAAFLKGPLEIDGGGSGLAFDTRTAMVTFEFQGAASIGEPQQARNQTHCVPAGVDPFSCGAYRSVSGTGSLAFLGTDRYTLTFLHINGAVTASFSGTCNALSFMVELDGSTLVSPPGGATTMGCTGARGEHDGAIEAFFGGAPQEIGGTKRIVAGVLMWQQDGATVTFTSQDGATSATFRRQ